MFWIVLILILAENEGNFIDEPDNQLDFNMTDEYRFVLFDKNVV